MLRIYFQSNVLSAQKDMGFFLGKPYRLIKESTLEVGTFPSMLNLRGTSLAEHVQLKVKKKDGRYLPGNA